MSVLKFVSYFQVIAFDITQAQENHNVNTRIVNINDNQKEQYLNQDFNKRMYLYVKNNI